MQTTEAPRRNEPAGLAGDSARAFSKAKPGPSKFLLVYEDDTTALRARQIMNELAVRLEGGTIPDPMLFRFELLRLTNIRDLVARQGETADVLVLCAHGEDSLPEYIKSWVTSWLGRKVGRHCMVLVSFDAASGHCRFWRKPP